MKVNSKTMSFFMLLPLLPLLASTPATAAYIDLSYMTVSATSTQNGPWNPQNIVKQDGLIETPAGSGVYSLTATDYAFYTGTISWRSGFDFPVKGINDGHPIITINLDDRAANVAQDYTIDKFHIWNYNSSRETGYGFGATTIQYSLDGTNWKTVPKVIVFKQATGAPAPGTDAAPGGVGYTGEDYVLPFPIRAHYVRFQADTTWGGDRGALGKVRFNNAGGMAPPPPVYTLGIPDDVGFINVKLAPYNAKGDGVSDDTAALQQAINDWQGTGRTLYLPNGKYLVSSSLRFTTGRSLSITRRFIRATDTICSPIRPTSPARKIFSMETSSMGCSRPMATSTWLIRVLARLPSPAMMPRTTSKTPASPSPAFPGRLAWRLPRTAI